MLCLAGAFSSDQRVFLIQRPLPALALALGVPLGAADVVNGAPGELHHVKGIEADLGVEALVVGGGLADRLLIAAVHVDRDRPDRPAVVAELGEERLQRLGVAAGSGPHDRARGVVADLGEVALPAAVGDLVHADHHQASEPVGVEVIGDDAGDDRPDGVPLSQLIPRSGLL